jgi:hypothetical protein
MGHRDQSLIQQRRHGIGQIKIDDCLQSALRRDRRHSQLKGWMAQTDRRYQVTPARVIHPGNLNVMNTKIDQLIEALTQQ